VKTDKRVGDVVRGCHVVDQPCRCVTVQGGPKIGTIFLGLNFTKNINRFSKLFQCQVQDKTCSNIVTKDPTTPHVCLYTAL